MERPPRDIQRDRLINGPLLRYAYLTYGIMTVRQRPGVLGRCCSYSADGSAWQPWGVDVCCFSWVPCGWALHVCLCSRLLGAEGAEWLCNHVLCVFSAVLPVYDRLLHPLLVEQRASVICLQQRHQLLDEPGQRQRPERLLVSGCLPAGVGRLLMHWRRACSCLVLFRRHTYEWFTCMCAYTRCPACGARACVHTHGARHQPRCHAGHVSMHAVQPWALHF